MVLISGSEKRLTTPPASFKRALITIWTIGGRWEYLGLGVTTFDAGLAVVYLRVKKALASLSREVFWFSEHFQLIDFFGQIISNWTSLFVCCLGGCYAKYFGKHWCELIILNKLLTKSQAIQKQFYFEQKKTFSSQNISVMLKQIQPNLREYFDNQRF